MQWLSSVWLMCSVDPRMKKKSPSSFFSSSSRVQLLLDKERRWTKRWTLNASVVEGHFLARCNYCAGSSLLPLVTRSLLMDQFIIHRNNNSPGIKTVGTVPSPYLPSPSGPHSLLTSGNLLRLLLGRPDSLPPVAPVVGGGEEQEEALWEPLHQQQQSRRLCGCRCHYSGEDDYSAVPPPDFLCLSPALPSAAPPGGT